MSDFNFCKNCEKAVGITEDFRCDNCGEEICVICGCTDSKACTDILGDSCHWVRPGVCSECAEEFRARQVNSLRSGMKL